MREINKHIIHCSDSQFGDVAQIRQWHKARGWKDIGYHFVIRKDGEIEVGRQLHEMGAHCRGENKNSIGTCLIGQNEFTEEQKANLRKLHKGLCKIFPGLMAYPHNAFNPNKTCPQFDVDALLK